MKKRALNKQQHRRVAAAQVKHQDDPSLKKGCVISQTGKSFLVECVQTKKIINCYVRRNVSAIVCGDVVLWKLEQPDQGLIYSCIERKSLLGRTNTLGKIKPLAANVDQVIITLATEPAFSLYLLDSYLVACETLGLKALILCNKSDLLSKQKNDLKEHLDYYHQLGYDTLIASAKTKAGIDKILKKLSHKRSVLVGQSGVGKSTLINAIVPNHHSKTQSLSNSNQQGMHTTTHSYLYHIAESGQLIDSPGVREFGLSHMPEEKIITGFVEFIPFLKNCKFRNCQHNQLEYCGLLQAIEENRIAKYRFEHYQHIKQQFGST